MGVEPLGGRVVASDFQRRGVFGHCQRLDSLSPVEHGRVGHEAFDDECAVRVEDAGDVAEAVFLPSGLSSLNSLLKIRYTSRKGPAAGTSAMSPIVTEIQSTLSSNSCQSPRRSPTSGRRMQRIPGPPTGPAISRSEL
jgi:hypothetical protein